MPTQKNRGGRPMTPRAKRELAVLELVDQTDDHGAIENALDAIVVAVAHARRRIGTAQKRTATAYSLVTTAQADEDDGPTPTPLAEIVPFPAHRGPEPSQPHHAMAA